MTKNQRIQAFSKLGEALLNESVITPAFLEQVSYKNPWFTPDNTQFQLLQTGKQLSEIHLQNWLSAYSAPPSNQTVGLIMAGNIPLVGFHDLLSCALMGFHLEIKISSNDAGLTPFVLNTLFDIEPQFRNRIHIVDKLSKYDLVIATGSNNTARYFEYYFGNKPHIIRKNRNSLALLSGNESREQLQALGSDIFRYFGLGCRSVSKIYVPKDYDFTTLFECLEPWSSSVGDHFKYRNNYDYNKSIYLINGNKHYDNGFLLVKEDKAFASPLAVLHYEEYDDLPQLRNDLHTRQQDIQCIVSTSDLMPEWAVVNFGKSQNPSLDQYADNVNTLEFLDSNRH